jgi:hypothetical protein
MYERYPKVEWKNILQESRSAKRLLADGVAELMNMLLQHMHPFARTVFQLGNLNIMYTAITRAGFHFFVNLFGMQARPHPFF